MNKRILQAGVVTATLAMVSAFPVPEIAASGSSDGPWRDPKPNEIVTVAGTGEAGYSGDGWDARNARLGGDAAHRLRLDLDADGNVYIADPGSGRVRVVESDGVISTVGPTLTA